MNKKETLEGEEIQKGLEEFLEQELYGNTISPKTSTSQTDAPQLQQIDIRRTTRAAAKSTGKSVDSSRINGKTNVRRESAQSNTQQRNKQKAAQKKEQSEKQQETKMQNVKKRNTKKQNKKKKKNKLGKVIIAVIIVFLLGCIGLYMIVGNMYRKMEYKEAESFTTQAMKEDGVINILLIGNDSRLDGDDGRSDAMILVSISDKTKTITMTSLLRDMYVEIPGHDGNRLNAAYSYGGPDLLMQTIEQNFDIPVHRYALVNFHAFANLVDAVGGVDLELTNDEVQYVNGYLMEYNQLENRDLATDFLDPSLSGMIHLNGPQALAYSRNRYIGTDFGRTERQRKVLSAVIQKLPGSVLTNGGELANGLFPNLTTNLKQNECYNLSLNAWKFLSYDMVQQCVPVEGTYSDATIREMAVLQVDFDANKQFLKSTLYGE